MIAGAHYLLEMNLLFICNFRKDVIVFDGINFQMENVTKNDYDDILRLCLVSKDHYDVVYKQEHIVTAGFCQCNCNSLVCVFTYINCILF